MTGELQSVPVRFLDRCAKLRPAEVHIGLEAVDALISPEGDLLGRVVRRSDLMVLDEEGAGSLEIGAGDVEVRADEVTSVDFAFQTEVGVGLNAAGRPHRRDAVREVE